MNNQTVHSILLKGPAGLRPDGQGQLLAVDGITNFNRVSAEHLVKFLHDNPGVVTRLLLCNTKSFGVDDGAADVVRSFFSGKATTLQKLEVYNCSLSVENELVSAICTNGSVTELFIHDTHGQEATRPAMGNLLQTNTCLQKLRYWNVPLDVEGAGSLQSGLSVNTTLTTLELRNCHLGDEGARLILNSLFGNGTLTTLNLSNNRITSHCLPVITELLGSSHVKTLNLSDNPKIMCTCIVRMQNEIRRFVHALSSNTTLETLDFSNCQVRGWAAAQLFHALETNETLECLLLSEVTYPGGPPLGNVSGRNQLLASLPLMKVHHLSFDWDFSMDAEAFVPALSKNTSLVKLEGQKDRRWYAVYRYDRPISGSMAINKVLLRNLNLKRAESLVRISPAPPSGFWTKAFTRFAGNAAAGASPIFYVMRNRGGELGVNAGRLEQDENGNDMEE